MVDMASTPPLQKWVDNRNATEYSLRQRLISYILDFFFPQSSFERMLRTMTPEMFSLRVPGAPLESGNRPIPALFLYRDPFVKRTIWTLKYRGNKDAVRILATLLYDRILEEAADNSVFNANQRPLLLPIPLSNRKKRLRGFNQCELICEEIQKIDAGENFDYSPAALYRNKDTESQTKQRDKRSRLRNVRNAFTANKKLVYRKTIILIDDVVTTGATLFEARRALHAAGVKKVHLYALAH